MTPPTMQDYGFPVIAPGRGTRILPIFGGCGQPGGCGPMPAGPPGTRGLRGVGKLATGSVLGLRGRFVTGPDGYVTYERDGWDYVLLTLNMAGMGMGVYHGYKRAGGWGAVGYGILGGLLPVIGIPVFFIQGFGKKKRG